MKILLKLSLAALFLSSCGHQEAAERRLRKQNEVAELISRASSDEALESAASSPVGRSLYPWEKKRSGLFEAISKDYFRCKGNSRNPPRFEQNTRIADCGGTLSHSLPLVNGTEHVYEALIDILNYIQEKEAKRVVITSGHRCPEHNRYVNPSPEVATCKHLIGAEVDFYVNGLETKPEVVISRIQEYYASHSDYSKQEAFTKFHRYEKSDSHTKVQPWFNQEVYFKLVGVSEGRDLDNRHGYPYINLQVRWDRQTKTQVHYSPQAAGCFRRG